MGYPPDPVKKCVICGADATTTKKVEGSIDDVGDVCDDCSQKRTLFTGDFLIDSLSPKSMSPEILKECVGTTFERWGKKWAWCCDEGWIYELTDPKQKTCLKCERFWNPVTMDEYEMERIQPDVDKQIDFPFYLKFYEENHKETVTACPHGTFKHFEYTVPMGPNRMVMCRIRVCARCHEPEYRNEGKMDLSKPVGADGCSARDPGVWEPMKETPWPTD